MSVLMKLHFVKNEVFTEWKVILLFLIILLLNKISSEAYFLCLHENSTEISNFK